mmetsp:Transcript_102216/g.274505  ORF Transcript_102216/g.274505 Transcript_102216/m.274505 type:complete len:113 (+) Transcript_102216:548-886(+)
MCLLGRAQENVSTVGIAGGHDQNMSQHRDHHEVACCRRASSEACPRCFERRPSTCQVGCCRDKAIPTDSSLRCKLGIAEARRSMPTDPLAKHPGWTQQHGLRGISLSVRAAR